MNPWIRTMNLRTTEYPMWVANRKIGLDQILEDLRPLKILRWRITDLEAVGRGAVGLSILELEHRAEAGIELDSTAMWELASGLEDLNEIEMTGLDSEGAEFAAVRGEDSSRWVISLPPTAALQVTAALRQRFEPPEEVPISGA